MPRIIDPTKSTQVAQALYAAADVDDGPTDEQRAVIGALLKGYFDNDVEVADLTGIGPDETASAFPGAAERRRMRELLVLMEFCRHPVSEAQVERVEEFAAAHDMCHVIAGYEPVAVDELALGAMQLAIDDTNTHWVQFLGSVSVHEAGFLTSEDGSLVPKEATLNRPGATQTLAHAFSRGARCGGDFTSVDHLALADRQLDDVRAQFAVPPREC